ncbi:MAG: hypothetical protein KDK72_05005, partial [Chlamydiia bacterium]|nr:hypothetical protein [Chlamydiia bacterium]
PGKRIVVGVLIGVNFIKDKEVLEEQHILTAIRNYIPAAKSVVNSFFFNKRGVENICTLYLEIEKDNEHPFSCEEIRTLRKELPGDLKDRIGHLMHPVFMPRNEEEIVKNILNLSNQVKFIRDLPQVFITFDEQSHSHLYFTVILVRVVRPCDMSVEDLFKESDTCLEYIHDRCKMVGMLRRKYAKEATVFRLKLPNVKFLRQDHSIDLYKARLNVVTELSRVIGDFRDYNGGMISKQNELLCAVRDLLKDHVKYNDLLLENFFYSLTPVVMRTVLAPETLKTLFLMLLEAVESGFFSGESYSMSTRNDKSSVYAMVTVKDRSLNEQLTSALNRLPRQPAELASSFVIVYDIPCFGYIYRNDDPQKQELFLQIISETLETWKCREAVLT